MKKCKYCGKPLESEEGICAYCGYNPNTDTMSPDFKKEDKRAEKPKQEAKILEMNIEDKQTKEKKEPRRDVGINPWIKRFAFIGLVVVVFSIFYKHHFNIGNVVAEARHFFSRIKTGKFSMDRFSKKEDKVEEKVEWVNVRSVEVPQREISEIDLILEGIIFAHDSRSFVIISGKVLSEGESINNITVKKIYKDSVQLIIDGRTKLFRLNQSIPLPKKR